MAWDIRGNLAIRDHVGNGRDLHLFEILGKGKPCRYAGQFVCTGWHTTDAPDRDGLNRQAIIFHLIPFEDVSSSTSDAADVDSTDTTIPLTELRQRALQAVEGGLC